MDLPGYGYAKVSKKKREQFEGLDQRLYVLEKSGSVCTICSH